MLTSFRIKLLMENECSTFKQLSRCPLIAESARVTCSFDELVCYLFVHYLWRHLLMSFWQDTFYDSINNILRVTVPKCKFLYQLQFFWKVFFWTYFLCSISKWSDPGGFPFPQSEGVDVNVLFSVGVFSKKCYAIGAYF